MKYYILASIISLALCIPLLTVGYFLAWLFNGEKLIIQYILILPFTTGTVSLIYIIWKELIKIKNDPTCSRCKGSGYIKIKFGGFTTSLRCPNCNDKK